MLAVTNHPINFRDVEGRSTVEALTRLLDRSPGRLSRNVMQASMLGSWQASRALRHTNFWGTCGKTILSGAVQSPYEVQQTSDARLMLACKLAGVGEGEPPIGSTEERAFW